MRETFPHSLPSLVHLPTSFVHLPTSFVHLPTSFVHSLLSFPHSPSSFPRRRESPRPCEATAFRFLSQSPRRARTGGKLAVAGNRQDATGYSRAQRKLVRARTRETFFQRHSHTTPVIPTLPLVIPAKAGIPAPVRGNGVPFPFPIAARSKNRRQTRRRRESTQCDRMQQSATKTRAHTRARHFPPRHSREGGNPRARSVLGPHRPNLPPPRPP